MSDDLQNIIGREGALRDAFRVLRRVAPTDSTVLVTGESGTGKELAVRTLHAWSRRAGQPLVPVNCGAIPRDLLESELFGYEKGAFTGAVSSRAGRFKQADHGTIFLDEIGELELAMQAKILRALQEREVEPVGGRRAVPVDVRIVAATNRDLEKEVEAGRFREDLFYRLNVIPVHLPPLRKRGGDIMDLVSHFLRCFCERCERQPLRVSEAARGILLRYPWPGNVRELRNYMERLSLLVDGDVIEPSDLPAKVLQGVPGAGDAAPEPAAPSDAAPSRSGGFVWPALADLERLGGGMKAFMDMIEGHLVQEALDAEGGSHMRAAARLGIKRTTLIEKIKRKGLER